MIKQLITYFNPRLAVLKIDKKQTKQKYLQAELYIKSRHKNYFHIFNLSSYEFEDFSFGSIEYTNFKWRQIPYSISETIKVIASIENYQVKNAANAAIICVSEDSSYGFALYIVQIYWRILNVKQLGQCPHLHAMTEFQKIYKCIDIKNPPIKIIDSFSFRYPQECFIPIVKVFNEGRHNNFEQIYTHNPQQQLSNYYIEKKKPLKQGTGIKFCQKRPETKYFSKPVIVFGDVKIEVYSYTTLKFEKQFVCGFNTKAMQYDQSLIILQKCDLYDLTNPLKFGNNQKVVFEISDFCEKCKDEAKCPQCLDLIKKLGNTYSAAQIQLQKICRNRSKEEALRLLG